MKRRQIIYACTIIVLECILFLPCVLIVSSTIIGNVLGILYALCLFGVLSSTRIGRWFSVEMYRSYLRLERYLFEK